MMNPLHVSSFSPYPLKMFSLGIERDQWHKMGKVLNMSKAFIS